MCTSETSIFKHAADPGGSTRWDRLRPLTVFNPAAIRQLSRMPQKASTQVPPDDAYSWDNPAYGVRMHPDTSERPRVVINRPAVLDREAFNKLDNRARAEHLLAWADYYNSGAPELLDFSKERIKHLPKLTGVQGGWSPYDNKGQLKTTAYSVLKKQDPYSAYLYSLAGYNPKGGIMVPYSGSYTTTPRDGGKGAVVGTHNVKVHPRLKYSFENIFENLNDFLSYDINEKGERRVFPFKRLWNAAVSAVKDYALPSAKGAAKELVDSGKFAPIVTGVPLMY